MTDEQKLLERAARSTGKPWEWGRVINTRDSRLNDDPIEIDAILIDGFQWNPLLDLADCQRLVFDRKMTLAHEPMRGGWSVGAVVKDEFKWLSFHEDGKHAVVLAAAAIGDSEA